MSISSTRRVEGDPGPRRSGSERVEVDDDELERGDRGLDQLAAVLDQPPVGEDPGVDPGVERLHPPVEHLREAGDRGHVGDRQPGLAEGPGGPTGRDELEAEGDQPPTQVGQPGLVADRQEGPARDGQGRLRPLNVDDDPAATGVDGQGTGQERRHRSRQEPVLDRPDPVLDGGLVVAGPDRDGLLGDDRAAVEGRVDEVDGRPGQDRSVGQRVAHGVGAREGRQKGRMGVEDPAREGVQHGRPDDPQVAGQDDDVGPGRRQGGRQAGVLVGPGRRVAARRRWHEGGLEALLDRPFEGRAGSIGEDEDDRPTELSPVRRRRQRAQVRPAAGDPDGDPAGHGRGPNRKLSTTATTAASSAIPVAAMIADVVAAAIA